MTLFDPNRWRVLSALLDEALELPLGERPQWLAAWPPIGRTSPMN